jgi:hypothetical protein
LCFNTIIIIIMEELTAEFDSRKFLAMTGVSSDVFRAFYSKYCGALTAIRKPLHLFILLNYYKTYQVHRAWDGVTTRISKSSSRVLSRIRLWERDLADRVDELSDAWNNRDNASNVLPHLFPPTVIGCVDTFPIYVSRPTDSHFQSQLYNGKYSCHVLKVQVVVDHSGTILWYSGPHIGTTHDIELTRRYPPPLADGEEVLADLAYIGADAHYCVPFKRRVIEVPIGNGRRRKKHTLPLSEPQTVYNRCHSWYRSTVEHTFGYVKRFRIINSMYRGKVLQSPQFIARAVRIILHITNMHLKANPHRRHSPIIDVGDDLVHLDFSGSDIRDFDPVYGTRHMVNDFYVGQKVQVYHNGTWWPGYVRTRSVAQQLLTINVFRSGHLLRVLPKYVRYHE